MKRTLLSCVAVSCAIAVAEAQQPQQQPPPTFRSVVDVVPVDVNVLDREGRPITGLGVNDFVLMVDGKPRRLVSAEFISSTSDAVAEAPRPVHYSSNSAARGRMIMFVIDQGNIGLGRGRGAIESAQKFIARLSPEDRLALVTIPAIGPQMDFTANHAAVSAMLARVFGTSQTVFTNYNIGLDEALRIHRHDPRATQAVYDRVCAGMRDPVELEICKAQVNVDAQTLYTVALERRQNTIAALRAIVSRLSLTTAPKTIIFMSEGLVIDHEFSELTWLGPAAARAQAVLYVLHLEPPSTDVSIGRPSPTYSEDRALAEEGLSALAGMTRGDLIRVPVGADFAFRRLATEISAYYLLSFEPEAGDRDGKAHKISVQLPTMKNVTIRARREFVVGTARVKSAEETLAEALNAPLASSDIGLKISTYTLRDARTGRPKIVVAADIDRSLNHTSELALGCILMDEKGKVVANRLDASVRAPIRADTRTQQYSLSVLAEEPGVHTVKVAVVDGHGKRGSVEHRFKAQWASAGQVRATDLLIGENDGETRGDVLPTVTGEFSAGTLHAYLELYSEAADVLQNASVAVEIASNEAGRPLDGTAARVQPIETNPQHLRAAAATLPLALLPPGDYVARAVISIDGRKAGQVIRPFRIARATSAAATAPGTGKPASAARAPIPFASRIDAFERSAVLAPPVVGFFLDRLNFGPTPVESIKNAVEHAKSGRFEEAVEALGGGSRQQLAAVFLQGLALYAKGDLEAAAVKFRETLRLDSEFFAAAFYLGSCYAAGGRDREAAAAWQTSLVTESDAPFIYTLLGDSLLRQRDVTHALDILREAASLWPDNDQVQMRLATALMMAGNAGEALRVLEPYLAKHPDDHERHFVALRAIYEARSAGRSIRSPAEDTALFDRYAAAYTAAKGPQQALVEEWRKFIDRAKR